jgi:hypothetical protein
VVDCLQWQQSDDAVEFELALVGVGDGNALGRRDSWCLQEAIVEETDSLDLSYFSRCM